MKAYFLHVNDSVLTANSPHAATEANVATEATAIVVTVVIAATTDETDTETEDAHDRPTTANAVTETETAMHMLPAETIEIGNARSDTREAATVEATENGTEIVAARAAMLDAMMTAMADAIVTDLMRIVVGVETAATTDSLASKNAEARPLPSAVSPRPI